METTKTYVWHLNSPTVHSIYTCCAGCLRLLSKFNDLVQCQDLGHGWVDRNQEIYRTGSEWRLKSDWTNSSRVHCPVTVTSLKKESILSCSFISFCPVTVDPILSLNGSWFSPSHACIDPFQSESLSYLKLNQLDESGRREDSERIIAIVIWILYIKKLLSPVRLLNTLNGFQ